MITILQYIKFIKVFNYLSGYLTLSLSPYIYLPTRPTPTFRIAGAARGVHDDGRSGGVGQDLLLPLGLPVLPEVYMMMAGVEGWGGTCSYL
jgi:hypothetical protein